jgi:hypothetical protein
MEAQDMVHLLHIPCLLLAAVSCSEIERPPTAWASPEGFPDAGLMQRTATRDWHACA